jgi:hypothetical protein
MDPQGYALVGVFAFLFTLSEGLGMSPSQVNSVLEGIIKIVSFYMNFNKEEL